MADSKEVKPSKGKEISVTSDIKKVSSQVFNPESDMPRVQNNYSGPSDCRYKITPEQMNALVSSVRATISESEIDNPKAKQVVDLVNSIRELHETVTEQKVWALRKVAQSEARLDKDYLELQELRMAKAKLQETENKKEYSQKSFALKIAEEYAQRASCHSGAIADNIRRLEWQNAQIRADTLAYKITSSESAKELSEILRRGKKCRKKLTDTEK